MRQGQVELTYKDKNDRKLTDAKKEQAQAHLNVKKREGNVKKAEKAYEDKVGKGSTRWGHLC